MKKLLRCGILFILPLFFLISCKNDRAGQLFSEDKKKEISKVYSNIRDLEVLKLQADSLFKSEDWERAALAYKELGKKYRKDSRFQESVNVHMKGLEAASAVDDTVEMVQAYNNIGTNYRRMGILDEASNCHYRALALCDQFSDTVTYSAKKNMVVSLNGLGNVNLTLGNDEAALEAFHRALKGERSLGSDLGMAINYANIGSILEAHGQIDSALIYYHLSMSHNKAINSKVGIALCHNHFGRIAENKGDFRTAYEEYYGAYDIMREDVDKWHWLESITQLSRICLKMNRLNEAIAYANEAEVVALEMDSPEHLTQVYRYKSEYYEKRGNMASALDNYKKSDYYMAKIDSDESRKQVQNIRINYVRDKGLREVELAKKAYENEQKSKWYILSFSLVVLVFAIFTIIMLLYVQKLRSKRNQALRKASAMQQSFFTNITHEFRTPLTVILGLAHRYEDKSEDVQEQEDMQTIIRQGNSLLQLVNQLLDVAKVRSAVGNPDWRTGDLVALAHMAVETITPFATQKYIDIEVVSQGTSLKMDFVPEYMVKIFHNLLSNAIKFTNKGGSIVISIESDKKNIKLTVADTGRGIPSDDLIHIFDSFYQSSTHGGHVEFQGNGIGLYMVKQMVQAMDGNIQVYSIVGKGTSFVITMPQYREAEVDKIWMPDELEEIRDESLKIACDETDSSTVTTYDNNSAISPEEVSSSVKREIVLVVEDQHDLARYISSVLDDKYIVKFAANGLEGLKKAEEFMPDIILTDVMMPEMDGFELCSKVRQSDVLNHIPIIVITAKNTEADKMNALSKGADAYLIKPFNSDELQLRVSKLLEQRRLLRQKFSAEMIANPDKLTSSDILNQDKTFLLNLHKAIYAHISDSKYSSDALADFMCMSRSQLNRKIKSITDMDTTSYIRQARIQYAHKLLLSTDEQIGTIMDMCGFEYRSYFNKVFKEQYGMTPAQCREQRK